MKIGLLFTGQGAQYTGMGNSLYEHSPAARNVMEEAGGQIKDWCSNGTKEMLRQTQITQPCIFTVSMMAYAAFLEELSRLDAEKQNEIEIFGLAGFSLGEYTALTAAGVIDSLEKGLAIVKRRGELMLEAGSDPDGNPKGGMVAAFGNRENILAVVDSAREEGILEGVNFNSQVQTVVAGDKVALDRFKEKASASRIKTIPLSVSTAFHSPMMEPAIKPLQELLLSAGLKASKARIYCNVTGREMFDGRKLPEAEISEFVAERMARQAKSPVYWQETIENMAKDGVEAFVEMGPGTTLIGMVKKIAPNLLTLHIEDQESLKDTIKALSEAQEQKGE